MILIIIRGQNYCFLLEETDTILARYGTEEVVGWILLVVEGWLFCRR